MTRVIDDESGIHFQCAKVIVEGHDKTIDIWPLTYIGLWMAMKFQRLPLCSHWCLSTQLLSVSIQFSGVLIFVEKSCVEFKYGFTWISWLLSTYFHSQLNLEHKVIKEGGTDYSIWRLERLLILPSAYSRLLSPSILTTNDEFHLSLRIIIRSIRWASKKTTSSSAVAPILKLLWWRQSCM